ncbi:alkaline phosphatase family protein [Streptomyces roseoverticillatus]|uniref:alkaline phosphatase family protein n=1 Tax=Streptomyces roseoverticillatus TaxID=66429 RepID=UPI0004C04AF4|nr:alkaline phosphatase family protein [Streptomyces roseoverticillatus]
MSPAAERALVIGLDGMPRSLLTRLAADGTMPRVAGLLAEGHCAELLAPVPEISSTSWATFLTGTNPGRHGIYGFTDLTPGGGYRIRFPGLPDLQEPPLWELAARAGRRTLCLNVPGTYPAPGTGGAVVSGFVAPDLERAVSPPRLLPLLRDFGYELDVEVGDVAADPAAFLDRAERALRARTRAMDHLLRHEPWDLAVTVLTETDRVYHFLWRAVTDPGHPLHERLRAFHRLVDDSVAALVAALPAGTELFLMSDHGFGPAAHQVYLNAWLRESGWLAPLDACPRPDALDARSTAFALDPARIHLNRKSRFPGGALTDAEADDAAAEIARELTALRCDGTRIGPDADGPPLLRSLHRAADVYHGPLLAHAPDLVAVPAPGIQLRGGWGGTATVRTDVLSGTHTRHDAVLYRRGAAPPDPRRAAAPYDMTDVAPTVLASIGIRPDGLDGTPVLGTADPPPGGPPAPLDTREQ